jgi:hypothetical protein
MDLAEQKRRTETAREQFVRDAQHLKDVFELGVGKVKEYGERMNVKALASAYPLALAGAAAGVGFVLGWRGGRRRALIAALEAGDRESGPVVASGLAPPPGKSLARRLFETAVLAAAERGVHALTSRAIESAEPSMQAAR